VLARYAVMGAPIENSLSPVLHQQFAKTTGITLEYGRILLDDAAFEQQMHAFFEAGGKGLNVTAPGKLRAFNVAEVKTKRCLKAGAANTLWRDNQKRVCADNTDGVGLVLDLKRRVQLQGARILCLGAGGAARGIVPALLDEKPRDIRIYNRHETRARVWINGMQNKRLKYESFQGIQTAYDVVLNTTGQWLTNLTHLTDLSGRPFCYDLSYAESGLTPFVQWARGKGYESVDGFGMLAQQAAEAFFVWHGVRPVL
jgi:shikimate dehydrogenase